MSPRIRSRTPAQTPIEVIFERVMRRKMTPQEQVYFQLRAPIEQMFSDIFKREMTPEERQILLVEPADTQGSKEIASHNLVGGDELSVKVINDERALRLGDSQVSRAVMGLREMFLRGEFHPGARIAEIPLASKLGISRTPLRLAFERLANEGLIQALPHSGFATREFSLNDIWEAIEARSVLEGAAARLAAERLENPAQLETLRRIDLEVQGTLKLDAEAFTDRYSGLNEDFHSAILDLAGNRVLQRTVEQIWNLPFVSPRAIILLHKSVPALKDIIPIAQEQHRGIIKAIERGEGARAESLAREHAFLTRRNLEISMGNGNISDSMPGASLIKFRTAGSC